MLEPTAELKLLKKTPGEKDIELAFLNDIQSEMLLLLFFISDYEYYLHRT